jgi:hypothetical protein
MMASYTILTTRKQEAGLVFSYDHYADKTLYPSQAAWLQARVSSLVTDPMYMDQQRASAISFDQSFNTIPETEQPAAKVEIEATITAHGGTVVPPTGTMPMPPIIPPPEQPEPPVVIP